MKKRLIIYDNGGETVDRFTIIIGDKVYGASNNPYHPQGFGQYVGTISGGIKLGKHLGKKIPFNKLSPNVKEFIKERME